MFTLMVVVFVLGYAAIALEHPLKIDKAATALLIGVITWVLYVFGGVDILSSGASRAWNEYIAINPGSDSHEGMLDFITHHEILHHLSEISTILFFLLGAMTIVEIVDQHQGFKIITDKIKTTNKIKLLWVLSLLTFFMSSALDNLTTTIVIVALIRKLINDKKDRWFFASMVVLAANAGGAWSPIGDVTTIMLWIGGQVTTMKIISGVFLPSLFTMLVPLAIVSTYMKGNITRPKTNSSDKEYTTQKERVTILSLGVSALLFVPVFKTVTHLPPYLGMLFGLGVMWIVTEIMHKNKEGEYKTRLNVTGVLKKVDVPTVLFFLGILTAVSSLQSAGHLDILAQWLNDNVHDIYIINLIIGILSSVVDNVPLVAGAMGMYPIEAAGAVGYASHFVQDGLFWEFLAYCAGTGGSILIIGSAAGVAAMGMEKIDFIWYFKKISLLAFIGYLSGAAVYYLEAVLFH
jgi:Na+/H+ antiporter NhaD/arsenite permease-like protein